MTTASNQELASIIAQAVAAALAAQNGPRLSVEHSEDEYEKTGANTHRAVQRGYAGGILIEEGEFVPADVPVGSWMEPIAPKDRKLARAVQEAQDESPKDVDLTALNKSALQAMAAERGINVDGLSKDDLITAIKAEREPTI